MDIKAKNNSTDVGKRINETKREIAQLNEELETLINSNFNKQNPVSKEQKTNIGKEEAIPPIVKKIDNSIKAPNMVSTVNLKYSKRCDMAPINFSTNMDNIESLCKRNKSYNKESAKAYIRQQREKREEERKKLSSKSKIDQEIRKQKLLELQQKSLALVQRNIKLSQERSKSRNNKQPIRIDKSICSNKTTKVQNKEARSYELHTETVKKKDISKIIQPKSESKKCNMQNIPEVKFRTSSNVCAMKHNPKQDQSYLEIQPSVPPKNITFYADNIDGLPYADKDLAATKIQAFYRGYQLRKRMKKIKSKSTDFTKYEDYAKDSKETQTNVQEQQITPIWLQTPPIDPYPCNFINTVKRKLQFVVNSINSRDVGTQSSITSSCSHEPHKFYNKNESNHQIDVKSKIKDRLISFNSHRYSNLDAGALQHMVLVHKDKKTKQNNTRSTESASDTSKNITDITSEVVLIPNHNVEAVSVSLEQSNNLAINTDKIINLHLRDPNSGNKANSHTFTKVLKDSADIDQSISKKSYTFNFYDDQNSDINDSAEETDTQKYVKSPRDSILSFNKCEYKNESNDKIVINSPLGSNQSEECVKIYSKSSARTPILSNNIYNDAHPTNANITRESNMCETSDVLNIIENIENSINTSLVSHISDNKSDTSCVTSNESKKSITISISENSVSKNYISPLETENALMKPNLSQMNLTNNIHVGNKNSSSSLMPIGSSGILTSKKSINSKYEEKKQTVAEHSQVKTGNNKQLSNITKSFKPNEIVEQTSIYTEYSHLEKQISHRGNVPGQSEFTSSYASSFCSENIDTLKKPDSSAGENKIIKSKEKPKSELNNMEFGNDIINNLDNEIETDNTHIVKNINTKICQTKGDMNEIHLKFEAEVHLLNDFNESLKQFMAVEKAFETIKNKNEECCASVKERNSSICNGPNYSEKSNISMNLSNGKLSSVNLCRGSEMNDSFLSNESLMRTAWKSLDNSLDFEISSVDKNIEKSSITIRENVPNNLTGLSIKMFEQLIKDEDVRIENLKTILKIREQALLDRTKGELAWLEIQRKHLKETGRLHEASLVKKKQRGILLKHQQERREMQRLKQLQKMQSNKRKTILKEQSNLIKAKLISEKAMSDMKIHTPRKRQSNGPMKVLKSSGSIHSETSLTKKTSDYEEILSITSKSQSICLSEVDSSRDLVVNTDKTNIRMVGSQNNLSNMKKALLMRQTALMERRKAVEDLLYRHQKLLEEEKKIEELELAANAIIMQIPSINQLKSIDGNTFKLKETNLKENSHKTELFSKESLVDNSVHISQPSQNELPDKTNKHYKHGYQAQFKESPSTNSNDMANEINFNTTYSEIMVSNNKKLDNCNDSVSKKSFEYSEDFEMNTSTIDTVNDLNLLPETNENDLSSISELIQDFSQIEKGISMLSKKFEPVQCSAASHNSHSQIESINEFDQSVIETNTKQHFSNKTDNNFSYPIEMRQCDGMGKFYSLLESSENDNVSDSENIVSSIITLAGSLTSIKEGTKNSPKKTTGKFIEDVIPTTVLSQNSQCEIIPSLSINEASVTYSENAGKPSQSDNNISHKKSAIDCVTEEVEDRIPSDNSSHLTTHEGLQKDESVDESSIIDTLPEDSTISEVYDKIVTEESNSIIHSIASISMKGIQSENINEDISVCVKEVNNMTESESINYINQGSDISLLNSYSNKPFEGDSLKQNHSNPNLKQEEKSSTINSVCETPPLESYRNAQNDSKEILEVHYINQTSLNENVSSEQTINEDIPDLNNGQLCYGDHQTSIDKFHDSCDKKNKTAENNSDESYSGIVNLFENESCKTNSNTTDISEKLSTDSEHLDISELSPSDNSDNYTDDFEDDKVDSISLKYTKNDPNASSSQSDSEMKIKKSIHNKGNEVLMMKIDLTSEEFNNQASIIIMSEDKAYFQENISNIDKNTDVCITQKELSCAPDSKDKSFINDMTVTEQILNTPRNEEHFEIMKTEDVSVNMTKQLAEDFTIDSPKSILDKDIDDRDPYVTTYEDITPVNSPETVSPIKSISLPSMNIFGSEAEELLKKQIAIEQEIKHLEQQQKEHLPFVYMREIPNKPPPPYTPPSSLNNQTSTILPSKIEDLTEICNYSAKVLYNAYLSNKLNDVTFSETDFKSINQTKSTKECCLFVFDLCREVVKNHYKKFEKDNVPYWLKASRDSKVILGKPFDYYQLEKHINAEVKHLLGFEKKFIRENSVIRWSKKKKDHVDEILALESQFEENEWLDYEKDELMVKNELTNEIFNVLLEETINIYKKIFS